MRKKLGSIALLFLFQFGAQAQKMVQFSPPFNDLLSSFRGVFCNQEKISRMVYKGGDLYVESLDKESFRPTKDKRFIASEKPQKEGASGAITKGYDYIQEFDFNDKKYVQYQKTEKKYDTDIYLLSVTKEGMRDQPLTKIEFNKQGILSSNYAYSDYDASQGQSVFKGYDFIKSPNGKYCAAFAHCRVFTKVDASTKYYDVSPTDICVYDKDFNMLNSNTYAFKFELNMNDVILGNDGQNFYTIKSTKRDNNDKDFEYLLYKMPIVSQNEDVKPISIDLEDKVIMECNMKSAPDGTIIISGTYVEKLKSVDLKNNPDGIFTMEYKAATNTFSKPQIYAFEGELKNQLKKQLVKYTKAVYCLQKIEQAPNGLTYVISGVGIYKDGIDYSKAILVTCLNNDGKMSWTTPLPYEFSTSHSNTLLTDLGIRFQNNELEVFLNDNEDNYDSNSKQFTATYAKNEEIKTSNCIASIKFDPTNGLPKRNMIIEKEKMYYHFNDAIWNEGLTSLVCTGRVGESSYICKVKISK